MAIRTFLSRCGGSPKAAELDATYALEDHFSGNAGPVYVFNSAAGLYAALRGRVVWSLNPLVAEQDPGYERTIARLPAVFHQLVRPFGS